MTGLQNLCFKMFWSILITLTYLGCEKWTVYQSIFSLLKVVKDRSKSGEGQMQVRWGSGRSEWGHNQVNLKTLDKTKGYYWVDRKDSSLSLNLKICDVVKLRSSSRLDEGQVKVRKVRVRSRSYELKDLNINLRTWSWAIQYHMIFKLRDIEQSILLNQLWCEITNSNC